METETSFSQLAPPVFDGENYQLWAVRMETYLEALDLWEAVEEDYDVLPLPNNPTVAQIKSHKEKKTRKSKAKATLFAGVSATIFTRVMTLKSAKEIWDYLKGEYTGDERIRGMKVLNLIREFELQKMKESETVKEYSDRLLGIINKLRLLGTKFKDSRIVENILVTVPEKYEVSITTLENTKDLSKITLAELLNTLQAQEQRRLMRQDGMVEEALAANHRTQSKSNNAKKNYPPCQHCGKKGHPPFKCWKRPDAKCKICNQLGHEAVICKGKYQKHEVDAQVANEEEEDHLNLFKEFTSMGNKKVRIGNGDYILSKGKGTVAIPTKSGTKNISDVLYVPDIDQNLLSVGQLMKKGFKVSFEDKYYFIYDATGLEILRVKMRGKNFSLDPTEDEEWSPKNLQSAENPPKEDICENETKKLSIFQKNKIWKKVDKPQGKMQMRKKVDKPQVKMKPKKEPTYFIDNHEMQQNRKLNSIYCKSKDQLADLRTKSLPVKGLQGTNSKFAASKARRSVRNML
ncbi:PREDICTED: uncharacterized protein LOC109243519 [Nicotiana attenuata]|uniref:uncharacterized protein LOC109243519 n=1 Tax=Nicotiana attenuata TaxID=49451 RepID=UPI0009054AE8|nr:PREDICTED: uncharacterized protein LOC109243519 [Nicotiana attenuata]